MKKSFSVLAIAAAAAMYSCVSESGLPAFAVLDDSETVRWQDKRLELDYRFEYISDFRDKDVLRKVRRSMEVDFFGSEYLRDTPEATAKTFRDAVTGDYKNSVSDEHSWNGIVRIHSHADVVDRHVLVYTIEKATYSGGAHGMETTMYSNYDLRTGVKLTLDDLFTPAGKAALSGKIRESILKEHSHTDWNALMESTCYSAEQEVLPTENFALSASHITFMYNPYDIACYAQGHTRVRLPLDGLEGFIAISRKP